MKQLKNISELAEQVEALEAEAFSLRVELHDAVQAALATGASDIEIQSATGMRLHRIRKLKGEPYGQDDGFRFRGADRKIAYDDFYAAPIHRFSRIDEVEWGRYAPGTRTRIIVQSSSSALPLDILYIPRASRRLLVGFHGAEDRRTLKMPKFQFVSSFLTREESLLFVSDSTLLNGPKINIGWLAGNSELHLGAVVAQAINELVGKMDYKQTVLVGHSAGGFAAILVGARVPNSRAVSINGQSVVTRYEPWTVKNLRNEAFPETASIEEMEAKYSDRLDLRVALASRVASSSFTHFGNRTDLASFGRLPHFPLLAEHFGLGDDGGRTDHGDALVSCEWESTAPSGHALPGTILPFVEMVLGEECKLKIDTQTDPRWYF